MNLRLLVPCGGLMAGLLTGWLARSPSPPVSSAGLRPSALRARVPSGNPASSTQPVVTKLSELRALWTEKDGDVTFYENLAGVPAASLLAWLYELLPPETYSLSSEQEKRDALRNALVERLAEQDPGALAGWLMRVPHGDVATGWTVTATRALLDLQTPEAVKQLALLEKEEPYVMTIRLEALAENDPEGAFKEFMKSPLNTMPEAAARWLMTDPARALAFCDEHPEKGYSIMNLLAQDGIKALRQFEAGLTNPEAQRQIRRYEVDAAARAGDAETFARLMEQAGRNQNDWLQDNSMEMLVRLHPEKVEALLRQFADRPSFSAPVLGHLASSHPELAAALMATPEGAAITKTPGGFNDPAATVLRTWSLTDPDAALAWLSALPIEQRAGVIPQSGNILGDLPANDWLAMTRGLPIEHFRAGQMADQALEHTRDPGALAEWCASFPDKSRDHLLLKLKEGLKDQPVAEELTRQLEAALAAEKP